MFWSDPNLYGATFPYKDVQAAMPWGPIPRYLPQNYPQTYPQTYGFVPPYFGMQPPMTPFMQSSILPFVRPEGMLPLLKPELTSQVGLNPYFQYNQPIVPWFRPFHF